MPTQTNNLDQTSELVAQVQTAYENQHALSIQGNGSKSFLIHPVKGDLISTSAHQGVLNYFPSELTVKVRSGTLLSELKQILSEKGQMLPFEPPAFSENATIGGTIATGLSGSSRPYVGSARDFVLGCNVINGRGELLKFGGEVMKNVAGYDLSRLISGSYGSLGVILDVSLKLLPLPPKQQSFCFLIESSKFSHQIRSLLLAGHPISGACYVDGQAYIRLAGSENGVAFAIQEIEEALSKNGVLEEVDNAFWSELNEQKLSFFDDSQPLWRLSFPAKTADDFEKNMIEGDRQLIEWGGVLRWFYSHQSPDKIRQYAQSLGGHAQLFRSNNMDSLSLSETPKQQPLPPVMMKMHQKIKQAMDPKNIFNQGCIYPEL